MTGDPPDPRSGVDLNAAEGPSTTLGGSSEGRPGGTTHTYRLDSDESPCVGVVSAVAAVTGREPTSLTPLYDAVDPDALDQIVDADGFVRVAFTYAGIAVAVDSRGRVRLQR